MLIRHWSFAGPPVATSIEAYRWELMEGHLASGNRTSDIDGFALHPAYPSARPTLLKIPPGYLSRGMRYKFRLYAEYAGSQGFADFSVSVNAPPASGSIRVRTKEGEDVATNARVMGGIIVTELLLSTSNWVDEPSHAPFSYTYLFAHGCGDTVGRPQLLQTTRGGAIRAKVPKASNGATISVEVRDKYGAMNSDSQCIHIDQASAGRRVLVDTDVFNAAVDLVNGDMDEAFQTGNYEEYLQLSNAVALALAGPRTDADQADNAEVTQLKQALLGRLKELVMQRDPLTNGQRVQGIWSSVAMLSYHEQLTVESQEHLLDMCDFLLARTHLYGSLSSSMFSDSAAILGSTIGASVDDSPVSVAARSHAIRAEATIASAVAAALAASTCGTEVDAMVAYTETFDIVVANLCPSVVVAGVVLELPTPAAGATAARIELTGVDALQASVEDVLVSAVAMTQQAAIMISGHDEQREIGSRPVNFEAIAQDTTGTRTAVTATLTYSFPRPAGYNPPSTTIPVCRAFSPNSTHTCSLLSADADDTTCICEEAVANDAVVVIYEAETLCSVKDTCEACSAISACGWCSLCGSCYAGTGNAPFFPRIVHCKCDDRRCMVVFSKRLCCASRSLGCS